MKNIIEIINICLFAQKYSEECTNLNIKNLCLSLCKHFNLNEKEITFEKNENYVNTITFYYKKEFLFFINYINWNIYVCTSTVLNENYFNEKVKEIKIINKEIEEFKKFITM